MSKLWPKLADILARGKYALIGTLADAISSLSGASQPSFSHIDLYHLETPGELRILLFAKGG